MKISDLLEPVTSKGLRLRVALSTHELEKYSYKHGYDNDTFHSQVWSNDMCECFMDGSPFTTFERIENPETELEILINSFLDDYPEFDNEVTFFFDN